MSLGGREERGRGITSNEAFSVLQGFAPLKSSCSSIFRHKKTGHLGRFFLSASPVKNRRETKIRLERVKGIEPSLSAWEAGVMPLYDTRSERLTLYQMCAWK